MVAVKTSARDEAHEASAEYIGTLIAPAQCRMRPVDADGHMAPVLVLQIELDTLLRTRMRVEQQFPAHAHQACEAAAKRLRVGTVLAVDAPLTGLRLVATRTQHVRVMNLPNPHHPTEEAARP